MTLVGSDRVGTQEQRVIDAALRCIARWGIGKTTLDDVAREASISRATIYRLFPGGKDALLEAITRTELDRFFSGLAQRFDEAPDLEDLLVAGMVYACRALACHEALQFVLAYEPEVVLPKVAFHHADRVLTAISAFAAPYLAPHVGADVAPRVAEWVARLVLTYTLAPADNVDVGDEESARRLVRTFVLPGLESTVKQ
ncbi:MAG: TetR/AcrR family transcriptional regulator [Acidimicrobiia bacterium]|nr:TetR/AcrR family transcriptional regulator [Acidimicrobiia bacterium]